MRSREGGYLVLFAFRGNRVKPTDLFGAELGHLTAHASGEGFDLCGCQGLDLLLTHALDDFSAQTGDLSHGEGFDLLSAQGVELVSAQGIEVRIGEFGQVFGVNRVQLSVTHGGKLRATHGLNLFVVQRGNFGFAKCSDEVGAEVRHSGEVDGLHLGSVPISDLISREFGDLVTRQGGDLLGGEVANLARGHAGEFLAI